MVGARGWGGKENGAFNGYRVSLLQDEKVHSHNNVSILDTTELYT